VIEIAGSKRARSDEQNDRRPDVDQEPVDRDLEHVRDVVGLRCQDGQVRDHRSRGHPGEPAAAWTRSCPPAHEQEERNQRHEMESPDLRLYDPAQREAQQRPGSLCVEEAVEDRAHRRSEKVVWRSVNQLERQEQCEERQRTAEQEEDGPEPPLVEEHREGDEQEMETPFILRPGRHPRERPRRDQWNRIAAPPGHQQCNRAGHERGKRHVRELVGGGPDERRRTDEGEAAEKSA